MSSAEQEQQPLPHRDHSSTPSVKKEKPFVACSLCRTSKAKCITSDPNIGKCDRCVRLHCACVVEPHKRGRKRTRGLELLQNGENGNNKLQDHSITERQSSSSRSPYEDYRAHDRIDRDIGPRHDFSVSPAHPVAFMSGSNRPYSLDNMLGIASNPSSKRPRYDSVDHGGPLEDVISSGDVPIPMAERLFAFFMTSLNPVIMLFDPNLHTLSYVRTKSKFLLATILSSAAKFIAPSVFARLAPIVARYSVTAVFGGHRCVETIQSWMLIYFWKNRSDDRAWTYVGVICRSAVEIGLDRTPTEPAPDSSESEERTRRNRIRTWMLAFMMDRAMSSASNKDWCLRGRDPIIRNPRSFSRHPLRLHGDAVIAGFAELRRIASDAIESLTGSLNRTEGKEAVDTNRQLLSVNYDLDKWQTYWQAETDYYQSPSIYMALLTFFGLHVRLTLNSFAVDLQNRVRTPVPASLPTAAEQMCHDVAVSNLKQLQHIHALDDNILKHAQDSIAIMVAYAAFFLRAITRLSSFSHEQRLCALLLITETSRLFKSVGENLETSAALQAEFLDQLATQPQEVIEPPVAPTDTQGTSGEFDAWLHSLVSPAQHVGVVENVDEPFHDPTLQPGPSVLLPHAVADTDISQLSGGQWEDILTQWLQYPTEGRGGTIQPSQMGLTPSHFGP